MKKKILLGILLGAAAGIIDVTPMILQKLSWDANISAFSMWVVIGFFLSVSEIKIHSILKGILFSLLALLPCAILISWKEPESLIPISIMTLVLGGLLGFAVEKMANRNN
ncbi:MAG: hypothetical protein V1904_14335 [Bacteroidota bacterium]